MYGQLCNPSQHYLMDAMCYEGELLLSRQLVPPGVCIPTWGPVEWPKWRLTWLENPPPKPRKGLVRFARPAPVEED